MGKPRKQTVDYFSHDTSARHRKTLTVLQNKYGNDGYAFWYKLLEILGGRHGHFYDFNDPSDWEYLLAETHISDADTAGKILDTLVLLNAIDKELYEQNIIWSQNFVDRLEPVYKKRMESIPERPVSVTETPQSVADKGVSEEKTRQIKLNKIKLNNNKDDLSKVIEIFESHCLEDYQINEEMRANLAGAVKVYSADWVIDAINEAAGKGITTWQYIVRILVKRKQEEQKAKKEV